MACQGVLKYCLRGFLGNRQRQTFFFFLDMVTLLLDEAQCHDNLPDLEEQLNVALALLESDFPIVIQVGQS